MRGDFYGKVKKFVKSKKMDLAYDDMYGWLVLGLNIGRDHFLPFLGTRMILYCKKCISRG